MNHKTRFILTCALAGAGICVLALVQFVLTINNNGLPWSSEHAVREHYLAIGHFYSQGFMVGFFFCFSLALAATGISAWMEQRRRSSERARSEVPPRLELLK